MLSFSLEEISSVMSNVVAQASKIEQALGTLQNDLNPIAGGAWQGEGARAFTAEMQSKVIPEFIALLQSLGGMNTTIQVSVDLVSAADDSAASVATDLGGIFESIF